MMKQLLIISGPSSVPANTQKLKDLSKFVEKSIASTDVKVSACHIDELIFVATNEDQKIIDHRNQKDLDFYDLVWFRGKLGSYANGMVALIADYLKRHNIEHINSAYSTRRVIGKVSQMYNFAVLGLAIPKTVSSNSDYLVKATKGILSYPMIVKDTHGSHGQNNYLVNNEEEFKRVLAKNPGLDFMAQEYIKSQGDYRVLIIGKEILVIHRQGQAGTHLNNTSQGAKASLVDTESLPAEIIKKTQKLARAYNYEITGIDIIIDSDTGKYYFLEINAQPQLTDGAFVPEKSSALGNYFRQLLKS